MDQQNLTIDPDLLAEFIDESQDTLDTLDSLFLELEERPDDAGVIDSIFRPVHSIKGNSSFFGFTNVKSLAHEMESLLALVRSRTLRMTPAVTNVLLKGVDELKAMFARVRSGEPEIIDKEGLDRLVASVKMVAEGGTWEAEDEVLDVASLIRSLPEKYPDPTGKLKEDVEKIVAYLSQVVPDWPKDEEEPEIGDDFFADMGDARKLLHGILDAPLKGQLPKEQQEQVCKYLTDLKACAQDDLAKSIADDLMDIYRTFSSSVGFDGVCRDLLLDKLGEADTQGNWLVEQPSAPEPKAPAPVAAPPEPEKRDEEAPKEEGEKKAAPHHEPVKTMRVAESQIDIFLEYVGELLIIGDMFSHLVRNISAANVDRELVKSFRRSNDIFATLSNNLQKSIMSIRKVSVKQILQKVPRMVRDIATANGKNIKVEVIGEDVEVDKSLIDLLDAPLVHMVRNAADHGIETPEERVAAGKPEQGLIVVSVKEADSFVVLEVRDDGAGLNLGAIRKKAESLGLVAPGAVMSERDVINFLFSAGVSTAKKVTDVSGRGVGMDVVRRMIDEAGGRIQVNTEAGKGSSFTVNVPMSVTTMIIPGYLINSADQSFVLPMDRIIETFNASAESITNVTGKGYCVERHGEFLPLVALDQMLGISKTKYVPGEGVLVAVQCRKKRIAVSVNQVLGVHKVVQKNIDGFENSEGLIAGGALLGDGTVALVIDVEQLGDKVGGF